MSDAKAPPVVNQADQEEHEELEGDHWGGYYKVLTPSMPERLGRLGVNMTRCPPGRTICPFHAHHLEDEVFYVLSGRGVFRYGDDALREIGPGDCITCPAGTGKAHQIANPFEEDLVYLAIGMNDANEVCTYPDSGKVLVRALKTVGRLEKTEYMDGEGSRPVVFGLLDS